ncbi:MAG: YkgJ family cysteine cluster protein [Nanoarchaeota archaeon]
MNECKAFCCQNGKLLLQTPQEVQIIALEEISEFKNSKILTQSECGNYHYNLEKKPCPHLKDSKCTIHTNPNRPRVCKDYPIFIVRKFVLFSPSCPAVKAGMLNKFHEKIEKTGFKIV